MKVIGTYILKSLVLSILILPCMCQKNAHSDVPLGVVKGSTDGFYVTNFQYSGCNIEYKSNYGCYVCIGERQQDGICFQFNENPSDISDFPKTIDIACSGPIIAIFVTHGTSDISYVGQSGSFLIKGRGNDNGLFGNFNFNAEDYDTGNTISISGEFNIP